MAIIYTEGFDYHGDGGADKDRYPRQTSAAKWITNDLVFGEDPFGNPFLKMNTSTAGLGLFELSSPVVSGRMAWYSRFGLDAGVGSNFIRIRNSTGNAIYLQADGSADKIHLKNNAGTVLATTTSSPVTGTSSNLSAWHHFDLRWDLDAVGNGDVDLYVDGVLDIDWTGTTSFGNWDRIWITGPTSGFLSSGDRVDFADIVVQNDNSTSNDYTSHRLVTMLVDADISNDFSPSTGTDNYALVDDPDPDQNATYVESVAANDRDVYGTTAPAVSSPLFINIKALCTQASGTPQIRLGGSDGTNESVSGNLTTPAAGSGDNNSGYGGEPNYVMTTAPDAGPWAQADLDALRVIVEASAAGLRVTQVRVELMAGITKPQTPQIIYAAADGTSIVATSTAFVGTYGGASHTDSTWECRRTDTLATALLLDTSTYLTHLPGVGTIVPGVEYEIRVLHTEDNTLDSDFSPWFTFATIGGSGARRYVPVLPGETIVMEGVTYAENAYPSDTTAVEWRLLLFDSDKTYISTVVMCDWLTTDTVQRKQGTYEVAEGVAFVAVEVYADLDDETRGVDFMDGWINPPPFGLTGSISLDGSAADLDWSTSISAYVKYVANTTGPVTKTYVDENGTFTNASALLSDTEEDILTGLAAGDVIYVTMVPYSGKYNKRRTGPRSVISLTIPGGAGGGGTAFLQEDGDVLLLEDGNVLLLET